MSLYRSTTRRHHQFMTLARNHALVTQQALTDDEIAALAARCPEGQRWAFEGWLRGTHELNGDLINTGDSGAGDNEGQGGSEWRRVRLWFNGHVIADSTVGADLAGRAVAYYRHRFAKLRVTVETTVPPEQ